MNSDDLALFAAVAHAGSLSRAAIDRGADQSSVSRRVAALEKEIGVRRFYRSGRGVVLTDRGKELLAYATKIDETLAEAAQAMRNSVKAGPRRLRIGAQATIARVLLGPLHHALSQTYPETRLRFVEGLAYQVITALNEGEIDLAVVYRPEHPGAMAYDPVLMESMCLITAADFPFQGKTCPAHQLAALPLIVPSTQHGIRVMVESLGAKVGFKPRVALECDGSNSLMKRLVMERCGCTLLPLAAAIEEVQAGKLKAFPLSDPPVERCVAIVLGKTPMDPSHLWQTSRLVRETTLRLVNDGRWPGARIAAENNDDALARTLA